jgi:hypothetical protein
MTDDPAAFESIASSLDSVLSSLYGPLTVLDATTTEPTTTTTSPATVASDGPHFWVYAYWEADCSGMSVKTEGFGSRSLGCVTWTGKSHGFKADFDESVYSVTVYKGGACDSAKELVKLTPGTCYDTSFTGDSGAWGVALV